MILYFQRLLIHVPILLNVTAFSHIHSRVASTHDGAVYCDTFFICIE